jgi:hypothetical protein
VAPTLGNNSLGYCCNDINVTSHGGNLTEQYLEIGKDGIVGAPDIAWHGATS